MTDVTVRGRVSERRVPGDRCDSVCGSLREESRVTDETQSGVVSGRRVLGDRCDCLW